MRDNAPYSNICSHVLKSDSAIRFAGIATIEGDIVATNYRAGLSPMLSEKDSQLSMMQSLIRGAIRRTMQDKLGRTLYATAVYEKVKRTTITMYNSNGKAEGVLMVSFEKESDHEAIITEKLMPFLASVGKGLAN